MWVGILVGSIIGFSDVNLEAGLLCQLYLKPLADDDKLSDLSLCTIHLNFCFFLHRASV